MTATINLLAQILINLRRLGHQIKPVQSWYRPPTHVDRAFALSNPPRPWLLLVQILAVPNRGNGEWRMGNQMPLLPFRASFFLLIFLLYFFPGIRRLISFQPPPQRQPSRGSVIRTDGPFSLLKLSQSKARPKL